MIIDQRNTKTKMQLFLGAMALPLTVFGQNATQPNFIVIMCDDLGYEDVSFNLYDRAQGSIYTPNIDRIASEGVRFTSAYATFSVSAPSRAGFITGRYPQRFGFETNPATNTNDLNLGIPLDEMTIAESVHQVGYTSGIIGKWHVGAHIKNHPCNRGFDEFYGHLGGGHTYYRRNLKYPDSYNMSGAKKFSDYETYIMRNHSHVNPADMPYEYLTDNFTYEALSFITNNQRDPFFLFLSYNAPHGPLQARDQELLNDKNATVEQRREVYAKMVGAVDQGVGLLLEKLDELGLSDDTVIFFLSDNGGPEHKGAYNGILREGKSSIYEGGYRIPFAMRWPSTLEAGGIYNKPVSSLDIFATISSLTSSPIGKPLDGVDLIPYVTDENSKPAHNSIYLRKRLDNKYAIRHGEYKLLGFPSSSDTGCDEYIYELYNLEESIREHESENIADKQQDKVKELKEIYQQWNSELVEPRFE